MAGGSVRARIGVQRGDGGGAWHRRRLAAAALGAVVALFLCGAPPAAAHPRYTAANAPVFEWIVLNAETGQVLGEQNADAITYPASLTKMMTLYLTFQALSQGRITLDTQFAVSPYAASRAPTKLGLVPGETVAVRDLIFGIVTKSANDAATVLAEGLAGSEENFSRSMNWTAHQLGMDRTVFANASGLPDPAQHTSARDIARLALALYRQFPSEYHFFATREFEFHGRIVRGHDHLLDWYPGADGIKTGFINASGYNLATSAVQNGHRLIGVIMGGRTARIRDTQMAALLDQGFAMVNRAQAAPPRAAVPVVAPSPVAVAAVPVATVAAAVAATLAAPVMRSAAAASESRPVPEPPAARRQLARAAPSRAAPSVERPREAADWEIQIGAFRAQAAAAHAAREAAQLAVARGKPRQIVATVHAEHRRLYRARLLHFTEQGAQAACSELHRRGFACTVLRPAADRFAS
jgi:D-alanyl-D-alanine carboxypeptidase